MPNGKKGKRSSGLIRKIAQAESNTSLRQGEKIFNEHYTTEAQTPHTRMLEGESNAFSETKAKTREWLSKTSLQQLNARRRG
jgi:hypothetical protein